MSVQCWVRRILHTWAQLLPPPHQVFVQGSLVNLPLVPHTYSRSQFKVLRLLMLFTQNPPMKSSQLVQRTDLGEINNTK